MLKYALSMMVILLFASAVHAVDNTKWCATVQAIYGVCSPQLIDNWLAHKDDVYISPKRPPKPSGTTIVTQIDLSPLGLVNPTGEKPKYKPCWYWNNVIYVKCRFVG